MPTFNEKLTDIVGMMPDDPLAQRFVVLVYYLADSEVYNSLSSDLQDELIGVVLGCTAEDLRAMRDRVNAAITAWNALSKARK